MLELKFCQNPRRVERGSSGQAQGGYHIMAELSFIKMQGL